MSINPNLINENLSKEVYAGVQNGLEVIADKFLAMLPERLQTQPQANEQTIQALGMLIEEKLQFENHGTGIKTLSKQVEEFTVDPEAVIIDKSLDCKLPPMVLGFAAKKLYESLGVQKKIYFGLGTPVHPHVLIETDGADGKPEFLDIDYNNIEPASKNEVLREVISEVDVKENAIQPTPQIIEESSSESPMIIRRRKIDIDRLDRKRKVQSYMQMRHVDEDQMRTRLTNPRYEFKHFTEVQDVDFLRLLDTNFLNDL